MAEEKVLDFCKRNKISRVTYYNYCRKFKRRITQDDMKNIKIRVGRPRKTKF